MKAVGAVIAIIALFTVNGCYYSRMKAGSTRPVEGKMEVIVHAAIERHMMESLGLFPFESPPEAAAISETVTSAYQAQLVQKRPFRDVRQVACRVRSDSEALWYGRNAGCDLVMVPAVTYAMDGSGAMPTSLTVRCRILDARTGMVLWDIKQNAVSEPGADIDLFWNTVSGQPAQRLSVLADTLARQFSDFLVQPVEKEQRGLKMLGAGQ